MRAPAGQLVGLEVAALDPVDDGAEVDAAHLGDLAGGQVSAAGLIGHRVPGPLSTALNKVAAAVKSRHRLSSEHGGREEMDPFLEMRRENSWTRSVFR